jgi:hypothetical protein
LSRSAATPTFLAAHNKRCNITARQKAMAHAILFPEATEKGRSREDYQATFFIHQKST